MKKVTMFLFPLIMLLNMNNSFAADKLNQYENQMIDKVWITTNAINENNESIPSSNKDVNAFFGIAQYKADGTFDMYTPEGKLKLSGDWSMSQDGKTRTLVAKRADGTTMFTRTVDNVTVEPELYTYRIYPNSDDAKVYFDIVHKPLATILLNK